MSIGVIVSQRLLRRQSRSYEVFSVMASARAHYRLLQGRDIVSYESRMQRIHQGSPNDRIEHDHNKPIILRQNDRQGSLWQREKCNFSTSNQKEKCANEVADDLVSITDHLDQIHKIPLSDVRNFCIIAHVDHGKSSLASRILEYTGNLGRERQLNALQRGISDTIAIDSDRSSSDESDVARRSEKTASKDTKEEITLLDTLKVERERGITVKASAASMLYRHPSATNENGWILLNMVDTPGHADFGMEVSKSLDSVEGAVLLFDAVQGVQAQTLSVHDKAKSKAGVKILPALTKIDIPSARPLEVALSVSELLNFDPDSIIKTSARNRIGIKEVIRLTLSGLYTMTLYVDRCTLILCSSRRQVLDKICETVDSPEQLPDDDGSILRAKVIDSWFEPRRGVICLIRVLSGKISEGDRISIIEPSSSSEHKVGKDHYSIQEVGIVAPHRIRTGSLSRGTMGYVVAGMRDPRDAKASSYMTLQKTIPTLIGNNLKLPTSPGSGLLGQHSVLYASVHPMDGDGFDELSAAVDRLALNDTGLEIQRTAGSANSGGGAFLGPGLRVGFQGLLHVEVFRERLLDEFNMEAIVTPPKVPYTIQYIESKSFKRAPGLPQEEVIEDLINWPPQGQRFSVLEPVVDVRILAPLEYAGDIIELIKRKRGSKMETKPIDETTWIFNASMPWADVVTDFHDELKTLSAGFASFDVSEADPPQQKADLVKVDILLNNEVVDPLAFVCHRCKATTEARVVCEKLQKVLPRQQFVTVIQAKADGKIIASERIRAYRKDVLTTGGSKAVGGGDVTRKKKLIEKQKKGKKRQQSTGKVTLSQAAFNSVISRSNN
ncbi:hypothetical protein HJC23_000716 [Cyclotella cryptica]|uniref:Tr-type G domain-containing protein n=1 Tax=Cyclotella cryptica TaxID=29204 RepID=A0ABD3QA43_9STRA|eukprot:CCRYP_007426-RC/>CCRYP_007426-RC protein AED:0.06 eAED:0.06 QI:208/1/0.85/1/0.83/0.71/7/2996/835